MSPRGGAARSRRRSTASSGRAGPSTPSAAPAFAVFDTPLGRCALAWSDRGLLAVMLPDSSERRLRARLCEQFEAAREARPTAAVRRAIGLLRRHLAGQAQDLSGLSVDLSGAGPFAQKIYRALRGVGPGELVSYAELARRVGSPGAARAVGQAMARNPLPLVVPCHRVIRAGGELGQFSAPGGARTKAALLRLEGVDVEQLSRTASKREQASSQRRSQRPSRGRSQRRPRGGSSRPRDQPAAQGLFSGAASAPIDGARARRALRRADPELAQLMAEVGPFRLKIKTPPSTFAALAEAIVYQQLSGKAASTIFGRLLESCGAAGGRLTPKRVLRLSPAELRAAGLSRSKAAAITELAEQSLAGAVPSLAELGRRSDQAIVDRLVALRGIGPWTVQMVLIFSLGRPDVLPSADYGVRKGFARAFGLGELPTAAELEARAEAWRPYRTVASWYLWRALELPSS